MTNDLLLPAANAWTTAISYPNIFYSPNSSDTSVQRRRSTRSRGTKTLKTGPNDMVSLIRKHDEDGVEQTE
jgi:hypothetical protein